MIFGTMFQKISGTSQTVSGTQNLELIVPNTAHTQNVPVNTLLLETLFLLEFFVTTLVTRESLLTVASDFESYAPETIRPSGRIIKSA